MTYRSLKTMTQQTLMTWTGKNEADFKNKNVCVGNLSTKD